ncbi:hypothetical protein [Diaphorobacter aerolatus]|uniref:DUF4124 domain-containing protein n=1 Tax=Diaphorobacter aerolatus TaxID=1288495 RepID=A0A7H0GIM7_9BURK|nr:hypothetical protein [Diaphorobacter aerolatus]QNP48143.1 hypothetical protein H9K75_19195 [Diaphorobacter aerolatus]
MEKSLVALFIAVALVPMAWSQDRIYRCGNEYTNNANDAKQRGCKVVEGGNVTVLQGAARPAGGGGGGGAAAPRSNPPSSSSSPAGAPKVDNADQKARDSDARAILDSELRKAQARYDDLKKEYNDGFPQRSALEMRNPQGYIERTAEIKANLTRAEADVEGIKRELSRLK